MDEKIIVFEEILPWHRIVITWYRLRGFGIFYYRITNSASQAAWCRRLVSKGSIAKIDSRYDFLSIAIGLCPDLAYENINAIYSSGVDNDEVVKRFTGLYGDRLMHNAFKKTLLGELQRFYYLNYIMHMVHTLFPDKTAHLVYTLNRELHRTYVVDIGAYRGFRDLALKNRALLYFN